MSDPVGLYDRISADYSVYRRPDPRWAKAIDEALGDSRTVLNVGAGVGSYEPCDRLVVAIDPSAGMRGQRPRGASPCVVGYAESLPFDPRSFDAAMAVLTIHHWSDLERGITELRRVAARVIVLTYDMDVQQDFWFTREYVPEIAAAERGRVPTLAHLQALLGPCRVIDLPVWHDHEDGFMSAFWRRPEDLLNLDVHRSSSALSLTEPGAVLDGVSRLRADLNSGLWHGRHADLMHKETFDAGFRLLVAAGRS